MTQATGILCAITLIGVAILGIVHPSIVVSWAKRAQPSLAEDDPVALRFMRFICVGGWGITLFILAMLVGLQISTGESTGDRRDVPRFRRFPLERVLQRSGLSESHVQTINGLIERAGCPRFRFSKPGIPRLHGLTP